MPQGRRPLAPTPNPPSARPPCTACMNCETSSVSRGDMMGIPEFHRRAPSSTIAISSAVSPYSRYTRSSISRSRVDTSACLTRRLQRQGTGSETIPLRLSSWGLSSAHRIRRARNRDQRCGRELCAAPKPHPEREASAWISRHGIHARAAREPKEEPPKWRKDGAHLQFFNHNPPNIGAALHAGRRQEPEQTQQKGYKFSLSGRPRHVWDGTSFPVLF